MIFRDRPLPRDAMVALCLAGLLLGASGCYRLSRSRGGAQAQFSGERVVRPQDIAVPLGYRVEKVAAGLTFPTAVVFDDRDRLYVVEAGYSYGESWAVPRLIRLEPDDRWTLVAAGDKNGPWNGAAFAQGAFYVSEGGELEGGRLLRIEADTGRITPLLEGLPSLGDHHTNGPVVGPDGKIYFAQGTMTNSGVVGQDNRDFGWLTRFPQAHDVPCLDLTLTGENFSTPQGRTGAYLPIGTPSTAGQVIPGSVPCGGAVMRLSPQGGSPELVAWGFRNPFGMAFSPKGRLFVTDNGYDERGARPVWGAADFLWAVSTGAWYGWPDYSGDRRLAGGEFKPAGKPDPSSLLARPPGKPPKPAALFGVHASANGFDFSRSDAFGHVGEAFVSEFGDQAPLSGKVLAPVGFKVVRVDPDSGVIEDFAVNKGKRNGPASWQGAGGLERPVSARFSPDGRALYVVDFGVITMTAQGAQPRKGTGVLWKITRSE